MTLISLLTHRISTSMLSYDSCLQITSGQSHFVVQSTESFRVCLGAFNSSSAGSCIHRTHARSLYSPVIDMSCVHWAAHADWSAEGLDALKLAIGSVTETHTVYEGDRDERETCVCVSLSRYTSVTLLSLLWLQFKQGPSAEWTNTGWDGWTSEAVRSEQIQVMFISRLPLGVEMMMLGRL